MRRLGGGGWEAADGRQRMGGSGWETAAGRQRLEGHADATETVQMIMDRALNGTINPLDLLYKNISHGISKPFGLKLTATRSTASRLRSFLGHGRHDGPRRCGRYRRGRKPTFDTIGARREK